MQVTIARQLGLEPTTVGNFFMNARRRSMDKWKEENDGKNGNGVIFYQNCDEKKNHSMQLIEFNRFT